MPSEGHVKAFWIPNAAWIFLNQAGDVLRGRGGEPYPPFAMGGVHPPADGNCPTREEARQAWRLAQED
jgi:hypothetical protein